MSVKILVLDIETAPETAYIWNRFETTVGQTQIKEGGYLLCAAWCWLNKPVKCVSIFGDKKQNQDKKVVKTIHSIMNEADIIIGHNVQSFDLRTLNARFAYHGLTPPKPYKICDTYRIVKKHFKLPSNSLESVSHYFGIEIKEKQPFTLWRDCMNGCPKAWKRMISYCKHDVGVTEQLYKKLIPWIDSHPNMGMFSDGSKNICPKCGSDNIIKQGIRVCVSGKYQQYQCNACGGWSRSKQKLEKIHTLSH